MWSLSSENPDKIRYDGTGLNHRRLRQEGGELEGSFHYAERSCLRKKKIPARHYSDIFQTVVYLE